VDDEQTDPSRGEVVVAVLAGGAGSRIGGKKALVKLEGKPLISYPLDASHKAGLRTIVVCKRGSDLPRLDVPVLYEPEEPAHPLCGILTALTYVQAPIVAVGCDMPFLPPELLQALAADPARARTIRLAGELQPLPSLYPHGSTHTLQAALAERCALRSALELLEPEILTQAQVAAFGDPARMFFSVNRPEDLDQAQRWLSR
jgi:molybdopterin-guanine dinucleotide biosynthesis protein A